MADYTIINSTASALASGGVTTAAYTVETGITLTDGNLAIVAALNGVAVMQDAASAAEKLAVGNLLVGYVEGEAPVDTSASVTYRVANATSGTVGTTAAYKGSTDALTPAELVVLLANDAVGVTSNATTDAEKALVARVLELGKIPGHTIT